MIDPKQVTAIIVTKGDRAITPVLDSLSCFGVVSVWDNLRCRDRKVFERYLAAFSALTDFIYVQDDDCLVDGARHCREYDPASGELLCNMLKGHQADYLNWPGVSLVGWGSIFPRSMVDFSPYLSRYSEDDLFYRECDRVFTYLNRQKTRLIDIGVTHLEIAHGKDRLSLDPRHGNHMREIYQRLQGIERQAAA